MGIGFLFLISVLVHPQPPLLQDGEAAPPIHLQDVDGHVHVLGGTGGRPAVLEFVSSGCASCQKAATTLCHGTAGSQNSSTVFIDAAKETAAALRAFGARYAGGSCDGALLLDPTLSVSRAYEVSVVPTFYVLDSHGKISYGGFGEQGAESALSALQRLSNGH